MSMEDEAVVADIEAAGRLLSDTISRDFRFASGDLVDILDAARFSSHPYSAPHKEWPPVVDVVNARELPPVLIERYNAAGGQGTAHCGIFPAIRRAWATVDDTLFLWRFDKWDGQCPEYCGEEQVICAVGLAKTIPGVFVEAIQYLVVVANPNELVLLGVCCSASSDGSDQFAEVSLQLLPEYTISTDGVTMTCITTTEHGRIFLGGRDGHLYELLYTNGMRWQSRCRKVCHTAGISSLLSRWVVPNALKFGAVDAIVEIVIDDERNILYTRTQESKIQVFDLGKSGDAAPKKIAEESRVGDQRDGRYGGSRAPAVRAGGRASKVTIISISPVSTTESKWLHLVAVASDGRRIYLSTAPSSGGGHVNGVVGGKAQRPSVLRVVMTRPGPPVSPGGTFSLGGTPGAPRTPADGLLLKVEAAHYSSGVLLLSDASPASASRILVTTRDLTIPAATGANPAMNTAGTASRSLKALRETVTVLAVEGRTLAIADVLPTPDRAAAVEASVLEPGSAGLTNISTTDEEMTRAKRLWARGDLATQHILPRRRAIVLSTMGLMELIFNRPVDILQRLLEASSQRVALEEFFQRFGPADAAAMCLLLAARLTSDEDNMVPMSVMERAAEAFEDARLVGLPQMQDGGAAGGQVTPSGGTGGFNIVQSVQDAEPVFSGAHEGLCLCAARLLRSVWELPVMISRGDTRIENGDVGGVLTCRLPAEAMQTLEEKIRSLEQFLRARRNQRRGLYGRVMGMGDISGYGDSQSRPFVANGQSRDYGRSVSSGFETPPPTRAGVERPPMPSKRQRTPYSPSELVAMEVRGLECVRRLLRRSGEALRLLQLLQHHHITRLSQSLEPQVRRQLSQLTFHQLVCSADGEQVATRLVAALMEYYVAPDGRGTVDDISIKLREGCPSYYNESDYMFYQAVECLERAASVQDEERENLAREALELLGKVPETADLLSVCQRFEDIMFYEAVVELPLRKARALDPAEDAFNESVEESQRQAALAARQQCYDVVTNALRTLKGRSGQRGDMGTSTRPVPSISSLDDAAREAYIRQVVQLGVRWPDRAFHRSLYQTMIELGMENELLELAGPDLVPFLQSAGNYQSMQATAGSSRTPKTPTRMSGTRIRQPITAEQAKHLELLSRYYVRRRQHALAAHVLLRLAERRQAGGSDDLSLQQRFEYLSNAVLQARSATSSTGALGTTTEISDSGLLELLEGKLAVLRFQMKIRDELDAVASRFEGPTSNGNLEGADSYPPQGALGDGAHGRLAREKAAELGNELKSITQLYNDYAVPFELWEVCLEILNFSNYSSDKDNSVMRETWTRLLDQAIKRGGIADACSILRRVGPQLYPGGGGSLPLDSICLHLEKAAQERTALGLEVVGEEDIGRALLLACKGAAEPVQRTYDRLLASGAILPSPPLRLQMLRSVLYVMREWAQQVHSEQSGSTFGGSLLMGGNITPGQSGSLNRGVKDKLCTAANRYMTEVRRLAMPQSQLESVSRGFQELEEMLLG